MILALDISTSICGLTILSEGKIVYNQSFDFRNKNKFTSLFKSAEFAKNSLLKLKEEYDITDLYIEEPLQSFSAGLSKASVISTLSRFNGMISLVCFQVFGFEPKYIEPKTARKLCGIKIPKGTDAKKFCFQHNLEHEPEFHVEYTPKGNPKPESFDRSDSIIIARAAEKLIYEEAKTSNSKGNIRK